MEIQPGSYHEPSPLGRTGSQSDFLWEPEDMPDSSTNGPASTRRSPSPIVQNDNNTTTTGAVTSQAAQGLKGWQRPAQQGRPPPAYSFGGTTRAQTQQNAKAIQQPLGERTETSLQALQGEKEALQKELKGVKKEMEDRHQGFLTLYTPDTVHTANSYVRQKCPDNDAAIALIDKRLAELEGTGLKRLVPRSSEQKDEIAKLKADKKLLQKNPNLIADSNDHARGMGKLTEQKNEVQNRLSKTCEAIEQKVADNLKAGEVHVARLPQTELAKEWKELVKKHAPELERCEVEYAKNLEQKNQIESKRRGVSDQIKSKISDLTEADQVIEKNLSAKISSLSSRLRNKADAGIHGELRQQLAEAKKAYNEAFPELAALREEHDQLDSLKNELLSKNDDITSRMKPMNAAIKAARRECLAELRAGIDPFTKDMLSGVPVLPISVKDTVTRSSAQILDSNNYGMRVDPGTELTITRTGDNSYTLTFSENGEKRTLENCLYTTNFVVCNDTVDDQGQPNRLRVDIQPGETTKLTGSGLQILPTPKVGIYCDAACASKEPNGAQVMTFCDGCGQEAAARQAAKIVSTNMQAYVENSIGSGQVSNLREVAAKMCEGMRTALKEMKEDGTTTFTQVAVVSGYAVVLANGDSKTFVKRPDGTVIDITGGSRGNVNDASDPGGRVGIEGGQEAHDYRGLSCYVYKLQPGEQIFVCSDGIHDNFDPETVALSIQEAAAYCGGDWNLADGATWENSDSALVGKLKQQYMEKKIGEVVGTSDDATAIQKLQQYAAEQTRSYKEATFRGEDVKAKAHHEVPGKPDHATGVAMTYMGASPGAKLKEAKATQGPAAAMIFDVDTPYELKIATAGMLHRVYGRYKAESTETFVQVFKEVKPHPDNKDKVICIGLDGAPYTYDKSRIVGRQKLDKETVNEMANQQRSAMGDRQFEQREAQKEAQKAVSAEVERIKQEQEEHYRMMEQQEEAAAKRAEAEANIKKKPLPPRPPKNE